MNRLRSIRLRLALATAGVLFLLGGVLGVSSYLLLKASLDEEIRSFALHEAQEVANLVARHATREEIVAHREMLDSLFPEEGVVGLAVFSLDEQLVHSLPAESGPWSEPWPEGFRAAKSRRTLYAGVAAPGIPDSLRTVLLVDYGREPRWLVMATVSQERALSALARYRSNFGAGLVAALLLGFAGCYLLLSLALRPLGRMVESAARLAEGKPGAVLEEPPEGSELRELATLLNAMLARDRRAFDSLRRFTAHAGHELRTPLARIRGEAELALTQGDAEQHRECIASVLDETEELARVVEGLLELARGEEPDLSNEKAFALQPLLAELVEQARVVGNPREVSFRGPPGGQTAWVRGNRVLLGRALWNLLDNAVKFGETQGRVEIRLDCDVEGIRVEVADDGPGLPERDPEALFEPFRRGSMTAVGVTGHGLGLPLSRAVIRRHAGDVTARRDTELGGACFTVRLPHVPTAGEEPSEPAETGAS